MIAAMHQTVRFGCGHIAPSTDPNLKHGVVDCPACFSAFSLTPPVHHTMRESSTGRTIVFSIPKRLLKDARSQRRRRK